MAPLVCFRGLSLEREQLEPAVAALEAQRGWAAMESAAQQGLACATRAGDDGLRLQALRLLGGARTMQGEVDAGRALVWQGVAEAELAAGRTAAARQADLRARALALETEDPLQHDAGAGLACVALAEGDSATGGLTGQVGAVANIDRPAEHGSPGTASERRRHHPGPARPGGAGLKNR